MSPESVMTLGQQALEITIMVSAPMLLSGMVIGLLISIFQSVTQIQEITLTVVPKIVVVFVAFVLFLPWMMSTVIEFVQPLFINLPGMVR